MAIYHVDTTEGTHFDNGVMKGVTKQVLINDKNGWDSHVMRLFTLEQGGRSPKHSHPWPHIAYVVEGQGVIGIDGKETKVRAGSYGYVPPDSEHQFVNTGNEQMKFICIVPPEGDV